MSERAAHAYGELRILDSRHLEFKSSDFRLPIPISDWRAQMGHHCGGN